MSTRVESACAILTGVAPSASMILRSSAARCGMRASACPNCASPSTRTRNPPSLPPTSAERRATISGRLLQYAERESGEYTAGTASSTAPSASAPRARGTLATSIATRPRLTPTRPSSADSDGPASSTRAPAPGLMDAIVDMPAALCRPPAAGSPRICCRLSTSEVVYADACAPACEDR
eukprot:366226-Chlamydomonas_euryale.AAC.6